MSEKKLNIKLNIAGNPYNMTIDARNEEIYRLAAREVNNELVKAQQMRVDGFNVQDGDLLALKELSESLSKHLEK